MSDQPKQPETKKYEILSLVEGQDWKYKVRTAYSGSIGSQLRAMLIDAARKDIASQMPFDRKESESRLTDEDAWDYAFSKLCYLEETEVDGEKKKAWKYRNFLYPPFIVPIIKVLVTPLEGSPPLEDYKDDLSVDAINELHLFFIVCFLPPPETTTTSEPPVPSSPDSGAEEKQNSESSESGKNP